MMTSDYYTIRNPLGLHLRAARRLVEEANRFAAKIELEKHSGPTVNAKSILGVLLLEGVQGTEIRVIADGPDAQDAIDALAALINDGFGEL